MIVIMKNAEAEQKSMEILGEALALEGADEIIKMQLAHK